MSLISICQIKISLCIAASLLKNRGINESTRICFLCVKLSTCFLLKTNNKKAVTEPFPQCGEVIKVSKPCHVYRFAVVLLINIFSTMLSSNRVILIKTNFYRKMCRFCLNIWEFRNLFSVLFINVKCGNLSRAGQPQCSLFVFTTCD